MAAKVQVKALSEIANYFAKRNQAQPEISQSEATRLGGTPSTRLGLAGPA
jgi:hypothetical protein